MVWVGATSLLPSGVLDMILDLNKVGEDHEDVQHVVELPDE